MSERGGGYYRRLVEEMKNPYGGPQEIVVQAVLHYLAEKTRGSVLDIGAGFGRHALMFAISGAPVHCIDYESERMTKLNAIAARERLPLSAEVRDLEKEEIPGAHAVIICAFLHHYLSGNRGRDLLLEMQAHTLPGGLNAVAAITTEGDFYLETEGADTPNGLCYFARGELRACYPDWRIISFNEYRSVMAQQKIDGSPHINVSAYLLAQKPW